jgi:hypothetical protein
MPTTGGGIRDDRNTPTQNRINEISPSTTRRRGFQPWLAEVVGDRCRQQS